MKTFAQKIVLLAIIASTLCGYSNNDWRMEAMHPGIDKPMLVRGGLLADKKKSGTFTQEEGLNKMTQPFKLTTTDRPGTDIASYSEHSAMNTQLYEFIRVKPLDLTHDYDLRFQVETTREKMQKYDSISNSTPLSYLFSPKIIDILMQICPHQIQLFDAIVECKDGILTGYKAINILNEVDVSDPQKSIYEYLPETLAPAGTIYGYRKCIFKKDCMGDIHIARDSKAHSIIVISQTLKNALEKAKVKGLGLDDRSVYEGRHCDKYSERLAEKMTEVHEIGQKKGWTQAQYREGLEAIIANTRAELEDEEL